MDNRFRLPATAITFLVFISSLFLRDVYGLIIIADTNQHTIQSAIDKSSNGDTVLVRPGVYRENISFNGKAIIVASHYFLTGDTSQVSSTIIDGSNLRTVVLFNRGENNRSIICGFTIKNGKVTKGIDEDPRIGDRWSAAGITVLSGSSPIIRRCIISGNNGSAIRIAKEWYDTNGVVSALIDQCIIRQNQVLYNQNDQRGPTTTLGGAIAIENNGMASKRSNVLPAIVTIQKCRIQENTLLNEASGGGIDAWCAAFNVINTIISDNLGAGFLIQDESMANQNILHCTIVNNKGKGIWVHAANAQPGTKIPAMVNSIVWNNNGNIMTSNIGFAISYSDIQGGYAGTSNIDANPCFMSLDQADYRLKSISPCCGIGLPQPTIMEDIDGSVRPNPDGSNPDLGAYETPFNSTVNLSTCNNSIYPAQRNTIRIDIRISNSLHSFMTIKPASGNHVFDSRGRTFLLQRPNNIDGKHD